MITLGADPEFFVHDGEGHLIPVCGLLGGTKGAAINIEGTDTLIQEDNVMAEWNIQPRTAPDEFAWAIGHGINDATLYVQSKIAKAEVLKVCAVEFPVDMLQTRQAKTFGCSPDFNAYTQGAAEQPISPEVVGNWRFAGGHVHIGYETQVDIPRFVAAAFADALIGTRAIAMGEKQGKRRELYGTPGRFRPTPYGVEYRTLSNFWTWGERTAYMIGNAAYDVGRMMEQSPDLVQHWFKELPWNDIRKAIATEDVELASELNSYAVRCVADKREF